MTVTPQLQTSGEPVFGNGATRMDHLSEQKAAVQMWRQMQAALEAESSPSCFLEQVLLTQTRTAPRCPERRCAIRFCTVRAVFCPQTPKNKFPGNGRGQCTRLLPYPCSPTPLNTHTVHTSQQTTVAALAKIVNWTCLGSSDWGRERAPHTPDPW